MTDITANVVVTNPRPIFTDSRTFRAVANGRIYIGLIDTDPTIPTNQIPVYIENEDGTHVQIAQPLVVNAAGKIVYGGQLVKVVTVQGHSMAIYDAYGSQVDYIANVLKYDPDRLRSDLQSDTLTGLVNDHVVFVKQPGAGSVTRTQHDKNAEYLSVTDFGAIGDGIADDSSAFNAAIQAAKLSGGRGMELHVPAPAVAYKVKNVNIDCAIHLIGSSKSSSLVKPVSGGDTCFLINSDFVTMSGITIQDNGRTSLSIGIQINKGYMTLYNCYIALIGTCISFAKNSGEHSMYNVRLAESKWGLIMPGGQVNTRLNGFVIGNVDGAIKVRESLDVSNHAPTEGLVFTDCLIAGCGNSSESIPAVDILGTRWTWFNNTMIDLSKFVALSIENAESVKITGGYLSSNQSANSPCLLIRGKSTLFDAVNLTVADSRSWGVKIEKTVDGSPDGARFTNLTAQNNDINPAQQGDLIIDSVKNVCAYNSKFASQKTTGISVLDNSSTGSSLNLDGCSMSGQAYVGGASCIIKNRNSPTHPEEQVGVVTIPNGANTVSTPLKIVPFESGKIVGVSASPASGNDVITSGVQGANIVFNRVTTGAATTVSFYAFSTK